MRRTRYPLQRLTSALREALLVEVVDDYDANTTVTDVSPVRGCRFTFKLRLSGEERTFRAGFTLGVVRNRRRLNRLRAQPRRLRGRRPNARRYLTGESLGITVTELVDDAWLLVHKTRIARHRDRRRTVEEYVTDVLSDMTGRARTVLTDLLHAEENNRLPSQLAYVNALTTALFGHLAGWRVRVDRWDTEWDLTPRHKVKTRPRALFKVRNSSRVFARLSAAQDTLVFVDRNEEEEVEVPLADPHLADTVTRTACELSLLGLRSRELNTRAEGRYVNELTGALARQRRRAIRRLKASPVSSHELACRDTKTVTQEEHDDEQRRGNRDDTTEETHE